MLKNLSIRNKLASGFGLVIFFILVSAAFSYQSLRGVYGTSKTLALDHSPLLTAMVDIQYLSTAGHLWFEEIMAGDDSNNVDDAYGLWHQAADLAHVAREGGEQDGITYIAVKDAQQRARLTKIEQGLTNLEDLARQRYAASEGGVGSQLDQDFDAAYDGLMEQADDGEQAVRAEVGQGIAGMQTAFDYGRGWLLLGLILALVASVVAAVAISRRIATPLRSLIQVTGKIREGHLDERADVSSRDEVGQLATAINEMVASIRAANEAQRAEKESVERKVEEAVATSEAEKQYLARSVAGMMEGMDAFAAGDLTVHLDVERTDDEIARLYEGFNHTVEKIRNMVHEVDEAVEATASSATQISSSSEELAAGTEEQSAQTHDVAAAVEQMVQTILENAGNASRTAEVARKSGEVAREGGEVVRQTVQKIRHIASVVTDSAATVERLGTSSEQVGDIVSVIDEIADQTNLLALNAAIEAARAGDQGRGFAVVADEVRKLAERTSGATTEIAQMIKTIQAETRAAVEAMQQGRGEVEAGIALADRAGEVLDQIVSGTDNTVDMITQIAAASEEQSSASEQISRSVESIATVTNQSASGVSQIARATDDLSRLTENLRRLVAAFHTEGASPAPRPRLASGAVSGDGASLHAHPHVAVPA